MRSKQPRIGDLRWPAQLARLDMAPDPNGTGLIETVTKIQDVHVNIEPLSLQSASGMLTIIGDEQIETPATHRCFMRWHPYQMMSMFNILIRVSSLPDFSELTERFRIRRMHELDGRKRFLVIDVELYSAVIS